MAERSIEDIRREARELYGFVPGFVDDWTFEQPAANILWEMSRHYDDGETHIPMKYKHLLCYAVAAAIHCPYCTPFHKEAAEASGATDIELHEAALHALKIAGFSAFMHANQYPMDKYMDELERVKERSQKKPTVTQARI